MPIYQGYFDANGKPVVLVSGDDGKRFRKLDPGPSQKVFNHSPDGFAWGYGGSGPAQLALGILLNYYRRAGLSKKFGAELAMRYHQGFKWAIIAKLDQASGWTLTASQIAKFLDGAQETLVANRLATKSSQEAKRE